MLGNFTGGNSIYFAVVKYRQLPKRTKSRQSAKRLIFCCRGLSRKTLQCKNCNSAKCSLQRFIFGGPLQNCNIIPPLKGGGVYIAMIFATPEARRCNSAICAILQFCNFAMSGEGIGARTGKSENSKHIECFSTFFEWQKKNQFPYCIRKWDVLQYAALQVKRPFRWLQPGSMSATKSLSAV